MARRRNLSPEQIAYRKAAARPAGWMVESRFDRAGIDPRTVPLPSKPRVEAPQKRQTIHAKLDLSDPRIEARIEMNSDTPNVIWLHDHGGNNSVPGLRIRLARRSASWIFYRDKWDSRDSKKPRKITSKVLGRFPEMDTAAARDAAGDFASKLRGGKVPVNRNGVAKFGPEFDRYVEYLKDQAAQDGKVAYEPGTKWEGHSRWSRNVVSIGNTILKPKWQDWPLADISAHRANDDEVGLWYREVVKEHGPTQAAHAMRILRAVYLHAAKSDDTLSGDPTKLPTSAIVWRKERWQRKGTDKPGMSFEQFPEWLTAWKAHDAPEIMKLYLLALLYSGVRPGELARTPKANVDLKAYTLRVGNSKSGIDILVPLSPQLERIIAKANALYPHDELIFPTCTHAGHRSPPLGVRGHDFRRIWKTVATDCGISDEQTSLMLGHAIPGVSASYMLRQVLTQGPLLRGYQSKVGERVSELLGADPTR